MTTEPQRLQYLEAMGLTAWVARFRLPNARPSEACEWVSPPKATPRAPGERLHALLDEAARARDTAAMPPDETPPMEPPAARSGAVRGKARALLGEVALTSAEAASPQVSSVDSAGEPSGEALRFTLQVGCFDGRWLVVLPQPRPLPATEQHLLINVLRAAGVMPEQAPGFETFRWPQVEGLPVQAPLEEAREGLQAFLAGCRRRGWAPERLLIFGHDTTLTTLLACEGGYCPLLDLPVWEGPALDKLATSAAAKRALWPRLAGWREAWQGASGDA
ncbi:hypothetical protein [Halomonas cerina]|uniref:DNA polymerase III psi subunit n=1 Tax=Halomonas cerina TaxID=447424 RepID=A0A839VCQ6_9GAMM|nr:hypothetical protein [Halomonas cerina]MBB3191179.1 DNA polymerase III psi subunit [Halomonas cerina]